MDKRMRTLCAMESRKVDRVPVNFFRHFDSFGATEDERIQGMLEWYRKSNMDFLVEETDGYMEYPIVGNPKDFCNWKNIRPPKKTDRYFTDQVERTKRLIDGTDGACLFYILFTPFSRIKHTTHDETTVMEFYREDKNALAEVLQVIEETNNNLIDIIKLETDATGFFVSLQNAEKDRISMEEYREYLTEWDVRLLESVNHASDYNITHMCSWTGVPNNLSLWKDYDYKVVNWSVNIEENMDLQQGRSFFKPGTVVMGGFDNRENCILHRGSCEEIKKETKRQLDLAGQNGTILCADCSVQNDQSPERIAWVTEACEEYAAEHPTE